MGIGIVGIIFMITVSMIFSALPQDAFAGKGDLLVMVTVFDITNPNKHKAGVTCLLFIPSDEDAKASGTSNNGGKVRLVFQAVTPLSVDILCEGADPILSLPLLQHTTRVSVRA